MCLSSVRSAPTRFRRAFSSSRCRSLRSSVTPRLAYFLLPHVERCLRDPHATASIRHRHPRFALAQHVGDLLRVPQLLHHFFLALHSGLRSDLTPALNCLSFLGGSHRVHCVKPMCLNSPFATSMNATASVLLRGSQFESAANEKVHTKRFPDALFTKLRTIAKKLELKTIRQYVRSQPPVQ